MYAEARKQILRAAERIEGGWDIYEALDDLGASAWRLVSYEVSGRDGFFTDMPNETAMMFLYFVGHSDLEA